MTMEIRGEEVEGGLIRVTTWNWTVPENPQGYVVEDAPISGDNGWEGPTYYDPETGAFMTQEMYEEHILLEEEE